MKTRNCRFEELVQPGCFPLAIERVTLDAAAPNAAYTTKHRHDYFEISIVTGGTGINRFSEKCEFTVTRGDVFTLRGHGAHYWTEPNQLNVITLSCRPEQTGIPESELQKMPGYHSLFMLEPERAHLPYAAHLHLNPSQLAYLEHLAHEMEKELDEQKSGFEAALQARLMQLMIFLSRHYGTAPATSTDAVLQIGNLIANMEDDFTHPWTIQEMTRNAHMCRTTLTQAFRDATGFPPNDYLIRLRIQNAIHLLQHSEKSITEIAFDVGFNDSNYFARQFRRITGESPSAYRKKSISS